MRTRSTYRRVTLVSVAILATSAAVVGSSTASSVAPCTDNSTACLEAVAMTYINAIGSKDPAAADAIQAAVNVQRWENGLHNVSTRDQLVAEVKNTQQFVAGIREVRLFTARDGQNVFAMYLTDGGIGSLSATAHVLERIGIQNGLITQIEILQCAGGPGETSMGTATDVTGTIDVALCLRGNPAVPPVASPIPGLPVVL